MPPENAGQEDKMDQFREFIETHHDRFLTELFGLIRIPSVSSDTDKKDEMWKAAEYWKKILREAGTDRAEVLHTTGNPVVYAEKTVDPSLPTILVYGHYDVMPVDSIDLWESPPFKPEVRDGRIYARGAADDKGQSFMHAKAFEMMVRTGTLPCNVKFMIEGEEEIGSVSLPMFCTDYKEMLRSDIILVSDTSMISMDCPSITIGLRGLAYLEVDLSGPDRELHSGTFGGAVANPANALAKMIASLTGEDGSITIPGFYDDVIAIGGDERAELAKAPFDETEFRRSLGVRELYGEKGYTTKERIGMRPSLDVNGIWSGYTGEGSMTIIPSRATAKISMRLVPEQDPDKIGKLFEAHIRSVCPSSMKVTVKALQGSKAYLSPIDTLGYRAASRAIEKIFGKKPVPVRSGGSISIIPQFEEILGVKTILLGFGLESDAAHSHNENFALYNFFRGIETIPWFYRYFAEGFKKNP
ncbi:MAG TPA: dipeptidase [Bacteroidales bacterium]|nr:dipeptidase [Bacteroidales bacterium]